MKIINKQPRILGTCTGRRLMPGKNDMADVAPEEIQKILADTQFKGWQKLAWVAVTQDVASEAKDAPKATEPKADEPKSETSDFPKTLDDLNMDQAAIVIASCSDVGLLTSWKKHDNRKGVRHAAKERIAEVEGAALSEADEG